MAAIKGAHVFNRQLLERADCPNIVMAIRLAGVDDVIKMFLSEFLIIAFTQRHPQKIDGVFAQSLEIVWPKSGIEKNVLEKGVIAIEVLDMRRAAEHRHFFIDLCIDGRCHRIQRLNNLIVAERSCTALRKHRSCQSSKTFFTPWVVCRAGREDNSKRYKRGGSR